MRRKDYHHKRLSNPYFSKPRPRRFGRWFLVTLVAVLIGGAIYLSQWDRLAVTTVSVSGNEFISSSEIESLVKERLNKRRWLLFSQRNILFFSSGQTRRSLIAAYGFESVEINKNDFSTLDVSVTEKKPVASVVTNGVRYHVDTEGIVIRQYNSQATIETSENGTSVIRVSGNQPGVPEIVDESNTSAEIGKQILSKELVAFISHVDTRIRSSADFEAVRYIVSNPSIKDVILITNERWQGRLSATGDAESQVEALLAVLKNKVADRNKLEYIDVRLKDKVFFQ